MRKTIALLIALWLTAAPVAVAEELFTVTCDNSMQLDQRIDRRLGQLDEMVSGPNVDKMWWAILSVEIFALIDVKVENANWFNENCKEA